MGLPARLPRLQHAASTSYASLLFDEPYPNFGSDLGGEPVAFELAYRSEADRLTNGLRLIWMIPALSSPSSSASPCSFVLLVSWFVIIITGKHPRGMFDFIAAGLPLHLQT